MPIWRGRPQNQILRLQMHRAGLEAVATHFCENYTAVFFLSGSQLAREAIRQSLGRI